MRTQTQTPATKTCSKCKQSKPASEFSHYLASSDGLASYCKMCARLYSRAYRKSKRLYDIAYNDNGGFDVLNYPCEKPPYTLLAERMTVGELGELAEAIERALPSPPTWNKE